MDSGLLGPRSLWDPVSLGLHFLLSNWEPLDLSFPLRPLWGDDTALSCTPQEDTLKSEAWDLWT